MFSDHKRMKLETTNRRKFGNFINIWKFNIAFLINQWVKEEITTID